MHSNPPPQKKNRKKIRKEILIDQPNSFKQSNKKHIFLFGLICGLEARS